tara:strand:+ start:317 stop:559 length:243 start_codon:yes stop_codon:yes gene_type:complete
MFETWVLVCALGTPVCHTLSDVEGPYDTKKQCIERAYEIAVELPEYMPNYVATKYKCLKVEKDLEGKINTTWQIKRKRVD